MPRVLNQNYFKMEDVSDCEPGVVIITSVTNPEPNLLRIEGCGLLTDVNRLLKLDFGLNGAPTFYYDPPDSPIFTNTESLIEFDYSVEAVPGWELASVSITDGVGVVEYAFDVDPDLVLS